MANPQQNVRLPEELVSRIDQWRREQPEIPGRAEAIRQLIDAGLRRLNPLARKRFEKKRKESR
jgi:hypothetical protein